MISNLPDIHDLAVWTVRDAPSSILGFRVNDGGD
jgi:hypothetical protein